MRLIDADAFILDQMKVARISDTDWQMAYWAGVDDAIGDVANAPTIDAVEVVRCERCRYYFDGACLNSENRIAMKVPDFGKHYAYMADLKVPADHYCRYGKRRDSE